MDKTITACIDDSEYASAVCDAAAWASRRLTAPMSILHVIDNHAEPGVSDASGQIGLGTREHLLEELASLDEKRAKLAQEQGRLMLRAAQERAREAGVADATTRLRNGALVEALVEIEDSIRLLVLGKRGTNADAAREHLGSNLERAIRSLHCPILITPPGFGAPKRVLIAFDGSRTALRMIERIATSPLLREAECHIVFVGQDSEALAEQLVTAGRHLDDACAGVHTQTLTGEIETSLRDYQQRHAIDLLVMGAYGHSRIRHLLIGSTTTEMIRHATIPLLILR
ncbi:universal stress protein A [Salinisphaera orenii MK-B5]|uniref:Universal stress protein A n=1 Tax=Salinisphaera orenii MK-B5 TaxID=856730 RepID=A0A423PY63_9GAMM|nr:universal stress protein [Salinisphaera orenii]ROO30524.1 universal stress protein A [Salinisphaera orenii MK-B5]